jgi:serine protease Do
MSADSAQAERLRLDLRAMIGGARDRVFPALVNIHVVTAEYWGGQEQKSRAVGSGTIIDPRGYVLTNYHVTHNGQKFLCTLADQQQVSAQLVGEDVLTDLAVLRLNLSEYLGDPAKLPRAVWGNSGGGSDGLQVGDYVLAMGSPYALSRTVTLGIVSNTERVFSGGLGGEEGELRLEGGEPTGLFTRWIQHDALINPGNSGGPLVNLRGEVVGVNELGGSGIGYAIPSKLARGVAEALIEHGQVPRSWIGVGFKPIERTGLSRGVLVSSVVRGGPADDAGMQPGDLLVKLGSEAITVRFHEQVPALMQRIAELPIGSKVTIEYERAGQTTPALLTTARYRQETGTEKALRGLGVTVQQITPWAAQQMRLDSTQGVLVTSTRGGGAAGLAEPALVSGDVLHALDGRPVKDLAELLEAYRAMMDAKPKQVLVEFDRRGRNELTVLKPKFEPDDDPPRDLSKAWIGVATQPVLRDLARKLTAGATAKPADDPPDADSDSGLGFRITRVYPGTNAATSGLKVGDVVTKLEGDRLTPQGMQDADMFALRVRRLTIGDAARLTVLRAGQPLAIAVTLESTRLTPEDARRDHNRDFDLTVREITFFDRDENRWDDRVQGVIVTDVEVAGWAGLGGVRAGDVIQKIGQEPVRDLAGYRAAIDAVTAAQPERVRFLVLRGVRTGLEYIEPQWKPTDPTSQPAAPGAGPATHPGAGAATSPTAKE